MFLTDIIQFPALNRNENFKSADWWVGERQNETWDRLKWGRNGIVENFKWDNARLLGNRKKFFTCFIIKRKLF